MAGGVLYANLCGNICEEDTIIWVSQIQTVESAFLQLILFEIELKSLDKSSLLSFLSLSLKFLKLNILIPLTCTQLRDFQNFRSILDMSYFVFASVGNMVITEHKHQVWADLAQYGTAVFFNIPVSTTRAHFCLVLPCFCQFYHVVINYELESIISTYLYQISSCQSWHINLSH